MAMSDGDIVLEKTGNTVAHFVHKNKRTRYGLYVMTVLSVLVAAASVRFLFLDLATAAPGLASHAGIRVFSFYMHVGGASIALLIGPFQFFEGIRNHYPAVHRTIGITYIIACFIGGFCGVYIGYYSPNGPIAAAGFMVLGLLWPIVTALGLYQVLKKNIRHHRRWMILSFSLTFAAVTLRIYIPPMFANGMDPVVIFSIVAWISWLPNIYIANRFIVGR